MKKGEEIKIKINYDLYDLNVKNTVGVYVTTSKSTSKLLVYFPSTGEWGEFFKQQIKRIKPGFVTEENLEFISRVRKMKY